jgi:hypothetical protein
MKGIEGVLSMKEYIMTPHYWPCFSETGQWIWEAKKKYRTSEVLK